MLQRVTAHLLRSVLAGLLLAAGGLAPSPARCAETVQIAAEAMPQALARVLDKGREFEAQQRWGDALSHYEQALREYPSDPQLRRRFTTARLHFSLEKRYADASFVESVQSSSPQQAAGVYRELLAKIQSHYVSEPPWHEVAGHGLTALEIAIDTPEFRRQNDLRASGEQINTLRRELRSLASGSAVMTSDGAMRVERHAAQLALHRVGLSPVATALEFTAAAADTLDHYSSFLTPDQLRDVYSQIEGNFVGLGVELKADGGALLIVRVIPDSPAQRSGIRAGDRIVAVDSSATADLTTDEAASLLTGPEGSVVRVTVVTPSEGAHVVAKPIGGVAANWDGKPAVQRVVSVRREHVDVPSLEGVRIVDSKYGVAYVRVPVFQKTTSRDLNAALWDLHRQGMRSLVIDLRGNPGGLLTSSVELADKFIADGAIVSTRGRSDGEDFDYRAHRAGTWRVPLVVLIDGDSASASEIFAAAIRDNRRGAIVGERSFGKGSVQGIFPLGSAGAGIRLTTAKFFSPDGHPISKVGVNPDIVVRHATEVTDGHGEAGGGPDDAVLQRAVEAAKHQVAMR